MSQQPALAVLGDELDQRTVELDAAIQKLNVTPRDADDYGTVYEARWTASEAYNKAREAWYAETEEPPAVETTEGRTLTSFDGKVIDLGKHKKVVLCNPSPGPVLLLEPKEVVVSELILELVHEFSSRIFYRIVVSEFDVRVLVYPEIDGSKTDLSTVKAKHERVIFSETLNDGFLGGRKGVVVHVDGQRILSRSVNESSHDCSPSVDGASADASVGTPESTEGDQTRDVGEKKKHPAVTAAGCGEIKTNR